MARNDGGPRTPGRPMDTFAAEFLDRQARHWKPRTRETNSRIVRKDILPAFGHLTVDSIAAEHVRDWFAAMSDRPGIANRAMPTLSMMMHMAELWDTACQQLALGGGRCSSMVERLPGRNRRGWVVTSSWSRNRCMVVSVARNHRCCRTRRKLAE